MICRLEVRQVEKTKTTPSTRDVFLIVQGNPATSASLVEAGHDRLIGVLHALSGWHPGCTDLLISHSRRAWTLIVRGRISPPLCQPLTDVGDTAWSATLGAPAPGSRAKGRNSFK